MNSVRARPTRFTDTVSSPTATPPRLIAAAFRPLLALLVPLLLVACGGDTSETASVGEEAAAPTRAQRDSAIAESGIPGTGAVGAALDAAAAADARAQQHDTIG